MNEHSKMVRERKTKKSTKKKKKETAETEKQDTTCTSRTTTQPTPHLKKRWLQKARSSIGIVTPPYTIANGSGSEVVTNIGVCSQRGVSSETEKLTHDMRSEKICSHDGCYDIAKDGGICMKHKEEELLRQWFQTQFSGPLASHMCRKHED